MPLSLKQHSYTRASFTLTNLGNEFGEGAAAGTWHSLREVSQSLFAQGKSLFVQGRVVGPCHSWSLVTVT